MSNVCPQVSGNDNWPNSLYNVIYYTLLSSLFKTELQWHSFYLLSILPKTWFSCWSFPSCSRHPETLITTAAWTRLIWPSAVPSKQTFFYQIKARKKNILPHKKPTILQYHTLPPKLPSHDPDYIILINLFLQFFSKHWLFRILPPSR